MKFKDPLSSLKYLGGPITNHMVLAAFAGYVYFGQKNKLDCPNLDISIVQDDFRCVLIVFFAHALYVALNTWQKQLSKAKESQTYIKTLLIFVSVAFYFGAYMFI